MDNNSGKYFGRKVPEKKTAEENIRPGFLNSTDNLRKQDLAAQGLGAAEKSAINPDSGTGDKTGLDAAKSTENKSGLYTGGGKAALAKNALKGATKGKFSIKKTGAIFAIVFTLFIAGGIASLTQFFQPFDLLSQFKDTFNSMHVSANKRSDKFFRAQMETGRTKNPIRGSKIFGQSFKISKKQQTKLKEKGIEYDEKTFGVKVLKYKDDDGDIVVVAADEKSAENLSKELSTGKYDTGEEGVKFKTEAVSFKNVYASNNKFFTAYNAGSMTWRGSISSWFGKNTENFLKKNSLTRNRWEKWKDEVKQIEAKMEELGKSAAEKAKAIKEKFKEKMGKDTKHVSGGGNRITTKEEDEDGNKRNVSKGEIDGDSGGADWNKKTVEAKLDTIKNRFSGGSVANVGCAVFDMIGAINLLVYANEMLQILTLTTSYFEAIDKTEYGLGDEAPINEVAESLNEKVENVHTIISDDGKTSEDKTTYKTAIQSAGIAALYNYEGKVNPKDPSVSSFNLMSSTNKLFNGVFDGTNDTSSYRGCLVAKTAEATVNIVVDVATCVGTAFVGCILKDVAIGIATGVALETALSLLVEFAIPKVTNMLTRDLIADLGGEDLGNALTSGANVYQGSAHRANGGSLSNIDKYESYAVARTEVAAENVKYERATLSPFDTTSSNTFLGSMLKQMSSLANTDSLMSAITTSGSTIKSSVVAMLPTTMAASIAETLPDNIEEYEEVNPYLASIGAVGDAYGNPYIMTDVSTIGEDSDKYDPADVIDDVNSFDPVNNCDDPDPAKWKDGNFTCEEASDGNVIINEDSNLAKYIKYCGERSSPFGVADQNISSELGGDFGSTGNSITDGAIGSVPFVGDLIEIVGDSEQLANLGWITGNSCVAGNEEKAASSPDWEETKYYQRFVEDQSLAESMGLIEKSAVTAYLEEYYEANPLDNSYEGILARYSGMTKENVVALLDVIEYYDFIANYDASDRYAFGVPVIEEDNAVEFDNENVLAGEFILPNQIVYADVRNRVFTV